MDPGFKVDKAYPKKKANILSKSVFAWMVRYFRKGVKEGITTDDLFNTAKEDDSTILTEKLQKNWEQQLANARATGKDPSLLRAILSTFLWGYMVFGISLAIQAIGLRVFQPQVLGFLLRLFTGTQEVEDTLLAKSITGAILVLVVLISSFIQHHTSIGQQAVGMRVRVAVSSLVYRKMLRLNKQALGETAAGKVVNLLANDVNRFDFVTMALHYFWLAPIQVVVVAYFMWREVGVAALVGIGAILLLTLPLQTIMGKLSTKFRRRVAVRTDFRVRLMNEIISGIQVIKMYAWEKPFEKLVNSARKEEVTKIRAANYVRAMFLSTMVYLERTTIFLTLIVYVLMDNPLTSDITYTMTPYINLLQTALAIFLPLAIQMASECLVSIRRIMEFLLLEEVRESNIVKTADKAISVEHVNAKWTEESGILRDINFKVPAGKLCALIGPVGSGKTSALQLLLGELPTDQGEIKIGGSISYASQEPWLFGSSVKGNILFGQEYDKHKYNRVVKVCALEKDFKQFPYGDATLVGERGVSLSGGQRARINLARAVYRDADMYLLDDPLSAVDTQVGKQLFEECITGYLGSKTRILITHQLQYLKRADVIVVFNNGTIEAQGTFDELSKSNTDFTKMLVAADETEDKTEEAPSRPDKMARQYSVASVASVDSEQQIEVQRQQEEVVIPDKSVLWDYLGAAGNLCTISILTTIMLLVPILGSGVDYFLSWWTEQEETRYFTSLGADLRSSFVLFTDISNSLIRGIKHLFGMSSEDSTTTRLLRADDDEFIETNLAIYIYAGLIAALVIVTMIRTLMFFACASTASKNLHAKMFHNLLKAPMRFFDTNPSGRVLNRFSKDTGSMDETLPRTLNDAITITLGLIGTIVLICVANYWMTIPIGVMLILFYFLRNWYMDTAKSIKHVEGIVKSPVFSVLNSTLSGISTIRASNYQNNLVMEFDGHQNVHTSAWLLSLSCMTSFGLWVDVLCITSFAITVFVFVAFSETSSGVSGAMAGLAISQSLALSSILQFGMRQTAEVVSQLTSVERIMSYTHLDQEGPFESPKEKRPALEWPQNGKITFKNMSLRYVPDEAPVLKRLDIQIQSGEKVGIVGRTGAGKSSLISALFRLAPLEGSITIDDLDTQKVGLQDVRSRISIIPQAPVLFSATIRYNLDPFDEYTDQDLWAALTEVELKEAVPSLDYKVTEGGSNFSVGQRQLICLARAVIRHNRVLVLDEATANVDPQTDGLIQETIRKKFKDCTVLTIAHRLNTIMDSDKVLVMDAGRVSEFDHPHLLLQNAEGAFTKLVMETGPSMTETLREVARKCYEEKYHSSDGDKKAL